MYISSVRKPHGTNPLRYFKVTENMNYAEIPANELYPSHLYLMPLHYMLFICKILPK